MGWPLGDVTMSLALPYMDRTIRIGYGSLHIIPHTKHNLLNSVHDPPYA